jgi:hypothetical protein
MRRRYSGWLAIAAAALAFGCGTLSDRFGSTTAAPATGVAPWFLVNLGPPNGLAEPYILYGDATHVLTEPSYFVADGEHFLYYEIMELDESGANVVGRTIAYARSANGIEWQIQNGGKAVLTANEKWEGAGVGAPTVLLDEGLFRMWYAAGDGAGLGYAESADGLTWKKSPDNPIVVPDQKWEGGAGGVVASPSVFRNGPHYHLFYSGGVADGPALSRTVGWEIGEAVSDDGLHWTKRDAAGHDPSTGEVEPVLTPSQPWEGVGSGSSGSVCCPDVRVDHPVDRDVYRLYYTGNFLGNEVMNNVGIGFAGSFDGLNWGKLSQPFNPIVNERFPLTIFGASQYINYSEFAASVVKIGNNYRMIFGQIDLFGTKQGLGLAVNPNPNSF